MRYIFLTMLLIPSLLFAQQTAEFETIIYLEDTLGNKDSIIIGYDENEIPNFINSNFGEVDITNVPWDSTFEARVMSGIANDMKQSKQQIENYICIDPTNGIKWIVFTVAVRLQNSFDPLIVRWNTNDFASDLCRTGSFIVESPMYFNEPNPQGFGEIFMTNGSTYGTYWAGGGAGQGFFAIDEVGNQVLVNAFSLAIAQNFPSSSTDIEIESKIKTYPNPITDNFTINLPESYFSESVQIFDITGREMYQSVEKSNQIDVPSMTWAKGIYFYKVRLDDGILVSGKVVKN